MLLAAEDLESIEATLELLSDPAAQSGSGVPSVRSSAARCSARTRCGRWWRGGGRRRVSYRVRVTPDRRAAACGGASRVGGGGVCRVLIRAAGGQPSSGRTPLRKPFEGHWRARRGEYRVRYTIDDERREVAVLDIETIGETPIDKCCAEHAGPCASGRQAPPQLNMDERQVREGFGFVIVPAARAEPEPPASPSASPGSSLAGRTLLVPGGGQEPQGAYAAHVRPRRLRSPYCLRSHAVPCSGECHVKLPTFQQATSPVGVVRLARPARRPHVICVRDADMGKVQALGAMDGADLDGLAGRSVVRRQVDERKPVLPQLAARARDPGLMWGTSTAMSP